MADDVAWKMGDRWVILTERSPREMGREPMAVYYHPAEGRRFQYLCKHRPPRNASQGLRILPE